VEALIPPCTITQAEAKQHRNLTQRPSYGDPSSEMKGLISPMPAHVLYLPRLYELNEICLELVIAEDFAVKRGASLRETYSPQSLISYSSQLAAIYLIIVMIYRVSGYAMSLEDLVELMLA
jgi:hypothetical protein